jgi:hypothetical protein
MANAYLALVSPVADEGVAHFLDTDVAYTSGQLLVLRSNAVAKFTVEWDGTAIIANGGGVLIGHTAQLTLGETTSEFQLLGTALADSSMSLGRWSADAGAPTFILYKSRNAAIGSNTAVTTGDQLGEIRVYGDDGSDDDTISSAIIFDSEGTIATGQVPGVIKLQVAAAGVLADALVIASTGIATITTTASSGLIIANTTNAVDGTLSLVALNLDASDNVSYIAGTIGARAEGTWTSAGSSRDSAIIIRPVLNGTEFEAMRLDSVGGVYINETTNVNMTIGLTINQAANVDDILSFKSSAVAHGITDHGETDTYGFVRKAASTSGGLQITGLKDTDGSSGLALQLRGFLGETAEVAKTTSAEGVINLFAAVKSGTTITAVGTNGNLVVITNDGTARFIFDAEGTAHADDVWTDSVF